MKSLRTLSPIAFLILALLGACFGAATASGQGPKVRSSSWDNLKSLTPGQEIRVVMNNLESYQGKFESLSDGGITLRQAAGEQTLARKDILRVSGKVGQNHRVRNMLIGMAVGAGAGLVIGRIPYFVTRNCTEGPAFNCGSPPNPHLEEALTPVGGLAGAALGAAIPTGGWHDVYRAH
ncbi:MAG: hypothetical protein ACRD11_03965 [Terriglobia bacterium]